MKLFYILLMFVPSYSAHAVRITVTTNPDNTTTTTTAVPTMANNPGLQTAANQITQGINGSPNPTAHYITQVNQSVATMQAETESKIRAMRNSFVPYVPVAHVSPVIQPVQLEEELKKVSKPAQGPIHLDSIPDPVNVPYSFQSQGETRQELERVYKDLYKRTPQFGKHQKARELGLSSVEQADIAYAQGNNDDGSFYKELAQGFLDLVVGLDPITGMARSAWELAYGRNFITGATLSSLERSFAFLGVVTAGTSKNATLVGRGLNRVYQGAAHLLSERQALTTAIAEGRTLAGKAGNVLTGWKKNHKITAFETAADANKRIGYINSPPYKKGSHLVHFETVGESKFVRVHSNEGPGGTWMIRRGEIRGLTREQIRDKLNLPATPSHVSDVVVPKSTRMTRGITHWNDWGHGGARVEGQVQYRVEQRIPDNSFRNTREIGDIYQ